jgi:hypothetical protein
LKNGPNETKATVSPLPETEIATTALEAVSAGVGVKGWKLRCDAAVNG